MKVCVIGGANVDITATSAQAFRVGDSNPGKVHVSWGGVGRNIAHNLVLLGDEVELVNNADGELVGGIADMDAVEGMDTAWIAARLDVINAADAVVADSNLMPETLAFLIDHCGKPLYLDAVSVAKAGRIREAMALSNRKSVFALKSNALEYESLAGIEGVTRFYESAGAEGLRVHADGQLYEYPALPCIVRSVTGGGDALLAGIVHAGPQASVAESARIGLLCARCAVESPAAVNPEMKNLKL